MEAYMKSALPFYGVQMRGQRAVFRRAFAEQPLASFEHWRATVLALWREAAFREERYAAIELTGDRAYREYRTSLEALPLYEELIVTGAWWDYVDSVATRRVAELLRVHPAVMKRTLLACSRGPDPWLRRSAIICQVTFKAETDRDLLYRCIEPSLRERDFFIRKAIGWALRSYAWTDPDEIVRYVRAHEAELSPLSRREAVKNIVMGHIDRRRA
jgi:3-methyladenine DNA glycosylase AlkD